MDCRRSVIGRHGPHLARSLVHMRHGARSGVRRTGFHEQRADAVSIDAEILVAALGHEHVVAGREDTAQTVRVVVEPASEALVGDVDEGDQATLDDHARYLRPLFMVEVRAGRIVATAVKKRDVAGASGGQRLDHVVEADDAEIPVVIWIFDQIEPHRADDRRVIRPGRSADEHSGVGVDRRDQLETKPQRAASSGRLQARDPLVISMLAKQDRPKQLGEALVPRTSEVRLGGLRLEQLPLCLFDDIQDRRAAASVAEYADADVDLLRPEVRVAEGDQRKEGIGSTGGRSANPRAFASVLSSIGGD